MDIRVESFALSPGEYVMQRSNEYDLICIGSGPAGQRAAIQAAKLGKKVAVVENNASSAAAVSMQHHPFKNFPRGGPTSVLT
jgi:thioredoxin reductase